MDSSHVTDHSSSMSRQPPDEVFLSFRGPEMRRGFADFLYTMLSDAGIRVFRDEEELERGKENYQHRIQVIEQCKISIPIISKEYASSENCLTELGQMVEGMDSRNRIIIPIFYYVDRSDVRDCDGPFASSLVEHKERGVGDSVIDSWKSALRRIGELEGHLLLEKSQVSDGDVVKQIVHKVQQKLKKQDLIVPKQLVGVDSHVQNIMAKLKVDYRSGQAVLVLGIYGIPGVGKTVLAKCVYNQLYHLFDACSFLGEIQAEIKLHGVLSVQNKLISHLDKGNAKQFDSYAQVRFHIWKNFRTRKVLVLLDDVCDHEQLSELVGKLDWLGPGSRVILTSQTRGALRIIDGAESYVLEPMKQDEALKLFCRHAFGTDYPREGLEKLSTDIVAATAGLPSELEAVGSSLFLVKSKKAWRETLAALEVASHKRVQAALKKSYTNLDKNERRRFPDRGLKMDKSPVTSHSSSMSRRPPPDVFLSFRGLAGRFVAKVLRMKLTGAGIDVFSGEKDLPKGNDINGVLIAAISESEVSIPIISEDYASSKSCLMELEQMLKCMDNGSHTIIPIFYFVDPSDVRGCSSSFASSLEEHKERGVSDSVIDSWKSALCRIGELEGHHFHDISQVYHGEVVKRIVHQVLQKLKKQDPLPTK